MEPLITPLDLVLIAALLYFGGRTVRNLVQAVRADHQLREPAGPDWQGGTPEASHRPPPDRIEDARWVDLPPRS